MGASGVGDSAHGGLVQARNQHNGVHAGRAHTPIMQVIDSQLLSHAGVVTANCVHDQVQHCHNQQSDPGATGDLSQQHNNEHYAGTKHANCVNYTRAAHLLASSSVSRSFKLAGPVTHHAYLGKREGNKHAHDVELNQAVNVGVKTNYEGQCSQPQHRNTVGVSQAVTACSQLAWQHLVAAQDTG